jgi:hypothetical protein
MEKNLPETLDDAAVLSPEAIEAQLLIDNKAIGDFILAIMTPIQVMKANLMAEMLAYFPAITNEEKLMRILNVLSVSQRRSVVAFIEKLPSFKTQMEIYSNGAVDVAAEEEEIDLTVPGGEEGDMYANICRTCPAFKNGPLSYQCNPALRAAERAHEAAAAAGTATPTRGINSENGNLRIDLGLIDISRFIG